MSEPKRVVHYVNQFFGGIGAEDKADVHARLERGPVGPGRLLQEHLGTHATVVATVMCGDSYFSEHTEAALSQVLELIAEMRPDVVVAGPAFGAGRYGVACGAVCAGVRERLKIPAVTSMHSENPGVELYRPRVPIVPCGDQVSHMRVAMPRLAALAVKLANGEPLGPADIDGYMATGLRLGEIDSRTGAQRMVEMLVARLSGAPFTSEVQLPESDPVTAAQPLTDLSTKTIALVTTSGVVPTGNPDRVEGWKSSKYVRYGIEGLDTLSADAWTSIHGGYDTRHVRADPNRAVPLDALRALEREGVVGHIYPHFFTMAGNGAPIDRAKRFGQEVAAALRRDGVDGVIFTAT
jgi:glycine reductase complex component B subunit gamma